MRARQRPTRERVLDATLDLVARRGIAGTSVVDIEAAAGLAPGRGGFYRHFPAKEDALQAALGREIDRLRARQAAAPEHGDLETELRAGLRWLDDLGPMIAIMTRDAAALPHAARGLRHVVADGMTPGLKRSMEAGSAAGRDPIATAVIASMASLGYHLARIFMGKGGIGIDEEGFVDTLAAMISGL